MSGPVERADVRLDTALVDRGAVVTRSQAAHAIREGRVRVDGRIVRRAASPVGGTAILEVEQDGRVGRGGRKLVAALDAFAIETAGLLCLDLGASTGGFTQVLLERGAAHVVALDVGHGQLAATLAADPRVTSLEGVNARDLTAAQLAADAPGLAAPGLVVADLSFISLTLVLPAVRRAAPSADVICLIKPQFEVGRTRIGSGVVRSAADRDAAVARVLDSAVALGYRIGGTIESPMTGERGNREALAWLRPEVAR